MMKAYCLKAIITHIDDKESHPSLMGTIIIMEQIESICLESKDKHIWFMNETPTQNIKNDYLAPHKGYLSLAIQKQWKNNKNSDHSGSRTHDLLIRSQTR